MTAPSDFALRYAWTEGSVPPPYHYRIEVVIEADGSGAIAMQPGYGSEDVPTWTVPLALSPAERDALFEALHAAGLGDDWEVDRSGPPRIGGHHWRLTVTASGGTVEVRSAARNGDGDRPDALREAVRAAVPDAVWSDLHARRDAFVAARR